MPYSMRFYRMCQFLNCVECSRIVARIQDLDTRSKAFGVMVGIAHRHSNALVAEQFFHLVKVDTILYQPRCEGVPKVMKLEVIDFRLGERRFKGSPQAPDRDRKHPP